MTTYRQYYCESQICRMNFIALKYLSRSQPYIVVVYADVQSAAQMPLLSMWAVSKVEEFILCVVLFMCFSICPHRGSGRSSICITSLLIRRVKRKECEVYHFTADIKTLYLFYAMWILWKLPRNVRPYFTSQLQLAKTYDIGHDFFPLFFP